MTLSATFRLIFWSKLYLNLFQSIDPFFRVGLNFNNVLSAINNSMAEWS